MSTPASDHAATNRAASSAAALVDSALILVGVLALPLLTFYLDVALVHRDGALSIPDLDFWKRVPLPTPRALGLYLAWFAFQAALAALLPGRRVKGVPLADGRALEYTMNGWKAFVITLAV